MDITNCYLKCITNFEDEEYIDEYGVPLKKGSLLTAKINSDTCMITGDFTKESANEIAKIIIKK